MFFFFKQKTAYELRISDWSSDVCSSDLADDRAQPARLVPGAARAGARLLPRDFLRIAHGRASARHPRRRTAAPGPEWPLPCLGRDMVKDRKSTRLNSSH